MLRQLFVVLTCSLLAASTAIAQKQTAVEKVERKKKDTSAQKEAARSEQKAGFDLTDFESSMFNAKQLAALEEQSRSRLRLIAKAEKLLRDRPLYKNKASIFFRLGEYN